TQRTFLGSISATRELRKSKSVKKWSMKFSFTMCGQYSSSMYRRTGGQRSPSNDTTSSSWFRPDHSMYLSHFSPSVGVNGSVAMNHGVTWVSSLMARSKGCTSLAPPSKRSITGGHEQRHPHILAGVIYVR